MAPPVRSGHGDPMAMYSAVPPIEPVVRNNMVTQRQQQVNPQSMTHHPRHQSLIFQPKKSPDFDVVNVCKV